MRRPFMAQRGCLRTCIQVVALRALRRATQVCMVTSSGTYAHGLSSLRELTAQQNMKLQPSRPSRAVAAQLRVHCRSAPCTMARTQWAGHPETPLRHVLRALSQTYRRGSGQAQEQLQGTVPGWWGRCLCRAGRSRRSRRWHAGPHRPGLPTPAAEGLVPPQTGPTEGSGRGLGAPPQQARRRRGPLTCRHQQPTPAAAVAAPEQRGQTRPRSPADGRFLLRFHAEGRGLGRQPKCVPCGGQQQRQPPAAALRPELPCQTWNAASRGRCPVGLQWPRE